MIYRDNIDIARKYKSKRWQKLRKQKVLLNPWCERCSEKGIYTSTEIVHHKEYITNKNYMYDDVFFNIDNLESLCRECHNKEHFKNEEEYYFDENGDIVEYEQKD